ncbi:hypothetical protein BJY24_005067 [Nocardia transvalensis]|uniref:Uncharacterized protein n=1 Tax=Nocardia transvalensis TaxID=37333 RepID=A0A7W9UL04_9NOCA|nr:hypothetical protein [Nocardia transvalensis]MBB5916155.1 hypothetical protein [Nocardia transvalensis]
MTDIGPLAAAARATFGDPGVRAVVHNGRTVHAVRLGRWIGAEEAPELICHTGVAGWSPDALHPTRAEITCARCLRILGATSATDPAQLPLFGHGTPFEAA